MASGPDHTLQGVAQDSHSPVTGFPQYYSGHAPRHVLLDTTGGCLKIPAAQFIQFVTPAPTHPSHQPSHDTQETPSPVTES